MAAAGTPKDDTGLERKMESRHLTMISLGGVIGTGLFVSSGYTIHQAGPLGAILAYAAGSLLVYCVMVSLGELSVAMPYAGSFHMYAKRFIGPGTAFTIAILYWLNWAVALASEFTAAGLLMQRWFPHSPSWVWSAVFIVVVFAFSGTEVVGVAAGETKDPSRAIPKAVHTTVLRLVIFFIGSILVMAALIPWHQAGVDTSPFVLVFQSIGMPFAGDIMNFVVLTAVLSAANSGLYVCSRMVWSLAKERLIPERFARTNFRGVPVWAVLFSMAGSLLALLSSVIAASTVYLVLVAVSGLATLVVWFSVCVCHIRFRREWTRDGHSADELGYRAPGFPVLPWLAIVMCIGALLLVVLDETQRSTLYCMIPFVACCYAAYYALERQRKREKNT